MLFQTENKQNSLNFDFFFWKPDNTFYLTRKSFLVYDFFYNFVLKQDNKSKLENHFLQCTAEYMYFCTGNDGTVYTLFRFFFI